MKKFSQLRKRQKFNIILVMPCVILSLTVFIFASINAYLKNSDKEGNNPENQAVTNNVQTPQPTQLTVVTGKNTELDNIKPILDERFGEDGYKIAVENNKIVTRIAIPGISDAVAAAEDNGDYSSWNNIISEYTDHNSYILDLTEDNGLSYPVVLYGMNDNDEILFTLSGSTVAFAVIKEPEPESEIDVPEGWTVAGTRGEPTLGEKNALKKAKSYISHSHFSYEGLIHQLEYEKYSHSEAVYGAANCGADWSEEAYEAAESYLSHSSFSREGLIEQLEYEGFTNAQATYAVNKVGY